MTTLTTARSLLGRPMLPLLALLAVVVAACSEVGKAGQLGFWDIIASMIVFFFWIMFIWIFIALFGDIFRRNDLSGGMKAVWLFLLIILPFLGALIYIIARPKVTAQDVQMMAQAEAAQKAAAAVSPTDQITKLQQLKAAGAITDAEFETLKKQALGG